MNIFTFIAIRPIRCLSAVLGLLLLPVAGQAAEAKKDPVAYVFSGWSETITGNAVVQRWMARGEEGRGMASAERRTTAGMIGELSRDRGALRRIKNGLGVDYRIASAGGLHLNVYSRNRPNGKGVRKTLNAFAGAEHAQVQRWTLGASLQQVRTEEGDRFISLVPQLVVNPDGAHAAMQRWRFSMEYGYWFGGGKRAAVAERVLQVQISARF